MLMDGFCFHEAWGNRSGRDRAGLYLKFHAQCAPPAAGPVIHPARARAALIAAGCRDVIGEHCRPEHGRFAAIVPYPDGGVGPSVTVDEVRALIERPSDGRILVVARGMGGQQGARGGGARGGGSRGKPSLGLPGGDAAEAAQYSAEERNRLHYLDVGNCIGTAAARARDAMGGAVLPPFMTWIVDQHERTPGERQASRQSGSTGTDRIVRVYAYRMTALEENALEARGLPQGSTFVDTDDLRRLGQAGETEFGREEGEWARMFAQEEDRRGRKMLRGIGIAHPEGHKALQGTYNGVGNAPGASYVLGEVEELEGCAGRLVRLRRP
jgi:hypothetical protein